jgi:hypothetical protein
MKLIIDAEMLALIPVGIALWFMIWVLWNWRKEERRERFRSHADLPEIIIEPNRERETPRMGVSLGSGLQAVSSRAQPRFRRPADSRTRYFAGAGAGVSSSSPESSTSIADPGTKS